MTLTTIVIQDLTNPVELQQWFIDNPDVTITESKIILQGNIFYVVY